MCHVVAKTFSAAVFYKKYPPKKEPPKKCRCTKDKTCKQLPPTHTVLTSFWRKPFNGEWGDFSDVVLVQYSERTAGKGQNITTSEEPPDLIGKSLLNNTHLMVLTFRGINAHILGKFFCFFVKIVRLQNLFEKLQIQFSSLALDNWIDVGNILIYISEYSISHFTVDIG